MAKSMVEKYEQILSADPGSMVFVELAKALLDRGEQLQAITICQAGVQHHPESVVGRVLWGKALISAGKPAEAMTQFDEAIAIDRENPYAYNLIGEVLLHKGLHRSAIPILKKALSLQPNDNRVRQWLDQATRAVNGESEPVRAQYTTIDPPPPEQVTVTNAAAYVPPSDLAAAAPLRPPDPFQTAALSSPSDSEILRGMTDIFQALGSSEPAAAPPPPPKPLSNPAARAPAITPAISQPIPKLEDWVSMPEEPAPNGVAGPEKPPPPIAAQDLPPSEPPPGNRSVHDFETREVPPPVFGSHDAATSMDAGAPDSSTPDSSAMAPPPPEAPPGPADEAHTPSAPAAPPFHESATLELEPAELAQLAAGSSPSAGDQAERPLGVAAILAADHSVEPTVDIRPPRKPITQPFGTLEDPRADGGPAAPEASAGGEPPVAEPILQVQLPPGDKSSDKFSVEKTDPGPPPPGSPAGPALPAALGAAAAGGAPTAPPGPSRPPPLNTPARQKASSPAVMIPPPLPPRPPVAVKVAGLADIPDMPQNGLSPSMELPKVDISPQAAEAIAKEYERELRERLAATARPETFLSKHALSLGGAAVAIVLGVVATQVFFRTKKATINVADVQAKARVGIEKDTRASYQATLDALSDLLSVSATDATAASAQAMSAYVHALLYREHGGDENDRKKAFAAADAVAALPEADKQASLVASARYYLADGEAEQRLAAKAVMDLANPGAEAHEIAGRVLMPTDSKRAMDQLKASLAADKAFVRAYVDLGDMYLERGELPHAKESFEAAKLISEKHPAVLIGLAKARIGMAVELDQAAADLAAMERETADLDDSEQANLQLVSARLMAEQGHPREALEKLTNASGKFKSNATEFALAMAEIHGLQGNYDQALSALQPVARSNPRDPVVLEAMAQAQLAMGKPRDALATTEPLADDRRLRLERGLAKQQLGDLEGARKELLATRRDNKNVSIDVAIALARLDLASGRKDEARTALQAISSTGRAPARAHLALGELALADGSEELALKELAEAAEDPHDAEAPLELGKELLAKGRLTEARAPLNLALSRNRFLTSANLPLGQVELGLGNVESARSHLSAYLKDHKEDPTTLCALARADILAGDTAEARRQAEAAVARAPRDPNAVWTRIQVSLAAGDGNKALRDLEKRAKSSRSADEWSDLADALLELGDSKDASGAYGKAARVDKSSLRALVGESVAGAARGEKSALKDLEARVGPAGRLPPPLQARALAALSRAPGQAPEKAKELAQAAVKAWGASGEAHLALGQQLTGAERTNELVQAKSLDPARPEARVALAESLASTGDRAQAFAEAAAALRIVPSGPLAERARAVINGGGDAAKHRPGR